MKNINAVCLILFLTCCMAAAATQTGPAESIPEPAKAQAPAQGGASTKEKFDLCLGMLKGYYDALDSRIEKSVALLLVVIGWLITSETARKSLTKEAALFWGVIIALTLSIGFLYFNISHFLDRFREIQGYAEQLNYVERKYFVRYQMPNRILPVYLMPVLILYSFILLLLFQIRYNFLSLPIGRAKQEEEEKQP